MRPAPRPGRGCSAGLSRPISVAPSRSRPISSADGALTCSTTSACQASSAVPIAPGLGVGLVGEAAGPPRRRSRPRRRSPRAISCATVAGVAATRVSRARVSRGTPMRNVAPFIAGGRRQSWGRRVLGDPGGSCLGTTTSRATARPAEVTSATLATRRPVDGDCRRRRLSTPVAPAARLVHGRGSRRLVREQLAQGGGRRRLPRLRSLAARARRQPRPAAHGGARARRRTTSSPRRRRCRDAGAASGISMGGRSCSETSGPVRRAGRRPVARRCPATAAVRPRSVAIARRHPLDALRIVGGGSLPLRAGLPVPRARRPDGRRQPAHRPPPAGEPGRGAQCLTGCCTTAAPPARPARRAPRRSLAAVATPVSEVAARSSAIRPRRCRSHRGRETAPRRRREPRRRPGHGARRSAGAGRRRAAGAARTATIAGGRTDSRPGASGGRHREAGQVRKRGVGPSPPTG